MRNREKMQNFSQIVFFLTLILYFFQIFDYQGIDRIQTQDNHNSILDQTLQPNHQTEKEMARKHRNNRIRIKTHLNLKANLQNQSLRQNPNHKLSLKRLRLDHKPNQNLHQKHLNHRQDPNLLHLNLQQKQIHQKVLRLRDHKQKAIKIRHQKIKIKIQMQ